jgi:hypothetical protein
MREILTEIVIGGSAADVWRVLTDLDRFAEWNPFIPAAAGEVREGARLRVRILPPGARGMTFTPTVTRVVPERELRWLGHLLIPGVFDGEHIFEIEPVQAHRVRFRQRELFGGVLVPLLWRTLETRTRRGFEAMNAALKRRVEIAGG